MLNPEMTLFEKTQQRFLKKIEDTDNSITKYYSINNPYLTITFNPYKDCYDINIVYDRKVSIFEFPMLPREINEKINDYTKCYINITVNVKKEDPYPFIPLTWSLKDIKYNIRYGIHINIKEYYEYLINIHNENNKHWCPSMHHINADLLNFLVIANTFDYL